MAAVAMKDLKILYDSKGSKRVNRADCQGNLYLFYQDKKEKIIIRDMFEEDARAWVKAVMRTQKLTPKQTKNMEEVFKSEVRRHSEDDLEYSLIVTNVSGKILGSIDVFPVEGENWKTEAIVQIAIRDQKTIDTMAEAVVRAVQNLHKNYGWYDKVFLRHTNGKLQDLSK